MSQTEPWLSLPGLTSPEELEFLQRLAHSASRLPGWIVELGTFCGRATAAVCSVVDPARVLSIDSYVMQHHGPASLPATRLALHQLGLEPRLLQQQSHQVPEDVLEVAMLLVDTDHRAEPLRRELSAWLPLLAPGGIVCLHDYGCRKWPEVTAVVDRTFRTADWQLLGLERKLIAFRSNNQCQT